MQEGLQPARLALSYPWEGILMGLFGNKDRPFRIPPQPKSRQIPTLNPAYFQQIKVNIESWGGSETLENVSVGIANAVFNVGSRLFEGYNNGQGLWEDL